MGDRQGIGSSRRDEKIRVKYLIRERRELVKVTDGDLGEVR